jgi:predicted DNA binding protein
MIETSLDQIRDAEAARVDLVGITEVGGRPGPGELPLFRLSPRQREVIQLARRSGYYAHPKETTAGDLAAELGVTTSTIHEHLHKAEEKLLNLSD